MFCRLQPVACRQQSPGQVVKWLIRRPIGSHLLEGYTCPDTAGTKNHHEPSTGNEASMNHQWHHPRHSTLVKLLNTHTYKNILCMCMHVYTHIYNHIHIIYLHMHTDTHAHISVCRNIHTHTCI